MTNPYNPNMGDALTATDVEDRAGVEPIARLLADRAKLVKRLAVLRPLYGVAKMWEHARKVELSRLMVLIVAKEAAEGRGKPTEKVLDAMAHAHPDYTAMVAAATAQAAEYVQLEEALADVEHRIYRGNSLLRYAASEPRA